MNLTIITHIAQSKCSLIISFYSYLVTSLYFLHFFIHPFLSILLFLFSIDQILFKDKKSMPQISYGKLRLSCGDLNVTKPAHFFVKQIREAKICQLAEDFVERRSCRTEFTESENSFQFLANSPPKFFLVLVNFPIFL